MKKMKGYGSEASNLNGARASTGKRRGKKKKGREEEIGLDSHALFLFLFSTHPVAGRKEGERERVVDTMAAIAAIAPRADGDEKDEDTRPTKSGGAAAAVSER